MRTTLRLRLRLRPVGSVVLLLRFPQAVLLFGVLDYKLRLLLQPSLQSKHHRRC